MRRDRSIRILAKGVTVSNDTWRTGLNNNTLVIGPSGAGKTRGYVIPNLLASEGSIVVTDTKGELYGWLRDQLEQRGYRVSCIDFTDPVASTIGYDPLDHIRIINGKVREQDVVSVAASLCPVDNNYEPFWDYIVRGLITSLISYTMAALPKEEWNLSSVCRLYETVVDGRYEKLLEELKEEEPNAFAVRQYAATMAAKDAEKMTASIRSVTGEKLLPYMVGEMDQLFKMGNRIDFCDLRRQKTALFVHVSDVDRSMDRLVALFYEQMFKALIERSDQDGFPVHIILDDFACGCPIQGFDNIISVIRSRNIAASIMIQSITQLEKLYGPAAAIICENCDTTLYLGGNDPTTARWIGERANKPPHAILSMPVEDMLILQRGQAVRKVQRYNLKEQYFELETETGKDSYPQITEM